MIDDEPVFSTRDLEKKLALSFFFFVRTWNLELEIKRSCSIPTLERRCVSSSVFVNRKILKPKAGTFTTKETVVCDIAFARCVR